MRKTMFKRNYNQNYKNFDEKNQNYLCDAFTNFDIQLYFEYYHIINMQPPQQLLEDSYYEAQNAQNKAVKKFDFPDSTQPQQVSKYSNSNSEGNFIQYQYRWVIVLLATFCIFVNGLANNNVIPIVKKLTTVYQISPFYANFPVTITFLVFALFNFPVNQLVDRNGLRFSFVLGTGLYSIGQFCFMFLDKGYFFAIIGAIIIAIGQPFIVNCPAKIATFWFKSQNRTMATTMIAVFQIIGSAVGFVLPAAYIEEKALGQEAKQQFFELYAIEFSFTIVCFILVVIFMRAQPPTLPSLGASIQKFTLYQSFLLIKKDKNLRYFIAGYTISISSFLTFGANSNLIVHAFGYNDFQIAQLVIVLLVCGITGAILASVYIKKTLNYGRIIIGVPLLGICILTILVICFNTINYFIVLIIVGVFMGLIFTPLIPISFDLMCQIGFPIGEANAIGILTGCSMICTFFVSNMFTSVLGLKTQVESSIAIGILALLLLIGMICFCNVDIKLKRRQSEKAGHLIEQSQNEKNTNSVTTESYQND